MIGRMRFHISFLFLFTLGLHGVAQDYQLRIEVEGNGFAHYCVVLFDGSGWATDGYDPCCEALTILGASGQPHVYTEVIGPPEPASSNMLTINGLPLVTQPIDVPLGFIPGALGEFTFRFKQLSTFPTNLEVTLEDNSLMVSQNLLMDSIYVTWGAPSDEEARFVVHIGPGNVTSAQTNNSNEGIRVRGTQVEVMSSQEAVVEIVDLLGRPVNSKTLRGPCLFDWKQGFGVEAEGVYFIRVNLERKSIVHKFLVSN